MPGSDNIILTGFMATGKTTVGRLVAHRLGMQFVDTDDLIEREHGSITEIFAKNGEEHFRRLERQLAERLAARRNTVIATGGGMMLDQAARATLERTGPVICLVADVETIQTRLGRDTTTRPMLSSPERLESLLEQRRSGYERFTQIATDDRTPEEVAEAILDQIS